MRRLLPPLLLGERHNGVARLGDGERIGGRPHHERRFARWLRLMELLEALRVATAQFALRLAAVQPDDWTRETPCAEWDVHYLVAHVVGGNRFASMTLAGWNARDAIEQVMSVPQLGSDPMDDWTETSTAQLEAFGADGALDQIVDHPVGSVRGARFLEFRVSDLTVHAWDLARSIGVDDRVHPELAEVVLSILERGVPGMTTGMPLGPDSMVSPQDRMLVLTGRQL